MTLSRLCLSLCLLAALPAGAQILQAQRPLDAQLLDGVESITEAELGERLLADAMVRAEAAKVELLRQQMGLQLSEIQRELKLDASRMKRLSIAAKGAIDDSLANWRSAQENQIRQVTQGAKPDQIESRLSGLGDMQLGTESPHTRSLWTQALSSTLSQPESASWSALEEERQSYRHAALASLLTSELERKLSLTNEQTQALQPTVQAAFRDYLPDMTAYVDRGGGLDLKMMTVILNAIPAEEQGKILRADQLERYRTLTQEYAGWWQTIQQNHLRRAAGGRERR
jgi:hypothetical protein